LAARLWETITTRLAAPPLALKIHALLVLAAAFLVTDPREPWWWARAAVVLILLWPLLRGSRFVWWVQIVGLTFALLGAVTSYRQVIDGLPGMSVFVDVTTFVALTAAIALAWGLLLLPDVRGYCSTDPVRRNAFVFALGVSILSSFPAAALGVTARLPSRGMLEDTSGAVFVGSDERGPVAFYVGERGGRVCLVVLQPQSSSRSCVSGAPRVGYPTPVQAGDVLVDVVPKTVDRVEVTMVDGTRRAARTIHSERVSVDLYYLLEAPRNQIESVTGYDAAGDVVYEAGEDY
jgi:hypothetical protein